MKRFSLFLVASLTLAACGKVSINPIEPEFGQMEEVELCATIPVDEGSKVEFQYNNGLYNRWEGNEELDVYIHSGSSYTFAGRIPAVEGTLSQDKYSLNFAGSVMARPNPEADTFVFVYTNNDVSYDWTKQTLDMTAGHAGVNGLEALKSYSPIVFTQTSSGLVASNKACYIKFTASGLGAEVKVKSLSIYSSSDAVFPKTFDLSTFDYQADNRSKTLSYAFENLNADAAGKIEVFLAAPIIAPGKKNFQIHVVTENAEHTISTLSTTGITSESAMSASKVYKLTRSTFTGATNPAATVGQTQGGSNGASDVVIESIVGQWDKTGFLSNDIYGVLDMGKPENLDLAHNAAINAIHRIYNAYFSGNTDAKIHRGAVYVAGKMGQSELTDVDRSSSNGPQYVTSDDDNGTFNDIVLTKDTEVFMTFIDSKAWNTNTVGYYCYTGANDSQGVAYNSANGHKEVHDLIVFPSTSQSTKGEHLIHKFEAKTTAQLLYPESAGVFKKTFPAGTTIGLMERVNALVESADFALKPISNDSPVHYTNIAWNKLNTLNFRDCDYWNQIAVLKFKMPDDSDFNRHGLIFAMKDKYSAHSSNNDANWTNPIILVYTSEADAINFSRSAAYWTHTVNIAETDVIYNLNYNLESVTSSRGDAAVTLNSSAFTDGKYTTHLSVSNAEFGNFGILKVVSGGVDITSRVVKNNTGSAADIEIDKSLVCGDVMITAHASRKVYVQSLTAAELNELGRNTAAGSLPQFRLILHSTAAGAGNVAFGLDMNGNSYCLPEAQSVIYRNSSSGVYPEPTIINVGDQYNDYEWSIEAADGGFKLKKVTKISDTDIHTDGFITRGPDYVLGSYPYVRLKDTGTSLTAEPAGSTYEMYIKSADGDYQYMTCAFGYTLQMAAFSTMTSNRNHVTGYGTWRVYKVWLQ